MANERVHREEWQMMDVMGNLYPPMVGLDFVVYRLPLRFARGHPNQNGPWGVRSGPQARGSLTQKLRAPKEVPPGTREASSREDIQFLGNPLQAGYPASLNTDACFDFSVMAYRAWDIAHGHCEAWQSTLVRREGPLPKGHDAGRGYPAQRGKVGYCPCYVRSTHAAIPQSYPLGHHGGPQHRGIRPWAEFGP